MNARMLTMIAAAALGGCSAEPQPAADGPPPLAGARIGAPFALTDQTGRRVTDRDFAGQYRIMYFGYTFCPDVCPVDVQMLAAGLKAFEKTDPARAAKVTPIFVTVDPGRDDVKTLKAFTAAFHPRMVGLTGDVPAITALAKGYGVWFQLGDKQPGGGYLVDHSRTAYLMGPQGQPIALIPNEGPPQAIAAELAKWVK